LNLRYTPYGVRIALFVSSPTDGASMISPEKWMSEQRWRTRIRNNILSVFEAVSYASSSLDQVRSCRHAKQYRTWCTCLLFPTREQIPITERFVKSCASYRTVRLVAVCLFLCHSSLNIAMMLLKHSTKDIEFWSCDSLSQFLRDHHSLQGAFPLAGSNSQ